MADRLVFFLLTNQSVRYQQITRNNWKHLEKILKMVSIAPCLKMSGAALPVWFNCYRLLTSIAKWRENDTKMTRKWQGTIGNIFVIWLKMTGTALPVWLNCYRLFVTIIINFNGYTGINNCGFINVYAEPKYRACIYIYRNIYIRVSDKEEYGNAANKGIALTNAEAKRQT